MQCDFFGFDIPCFLRLSKERERTKREKRKNATGEVIGWKQEVAGERELEWKSRASQ